MRGMLLRLTANTSHWSPNISLHRRMIMRKIVNRMLATAILAIIALAISSYAQSQSSAPARFDPSLFNALRWRNIGPDRGGRSIACAGSASRLFEYYFGATGGGLWKTTDGGTTWKPVTDGQIKSSSIGAVAVSESNPDVVFIGMGETELRGNI